MSDLSRFLVTLWRNSTKWGMIQQVEITLTPKSRGFHLVTSEILRQLPKLPKTGVINIFCKHTSCGLWC